MVLVGEVLCHLPIVVFVSRFLGGWEVGSKDEVGTEPDLDCHRWPVHNFDIAVDKGVGFGVR